MSGRLLREMLDYKGGGSSGGNPLKNICSIDGKGKWYISFESEKKGKTPSIYTVTQWLDLMGLWPSSHVGSSRLCS